MKNLSRMAAICFSWAAAAPAVAQSFPAIQQDGTMTAQGMINLHACVQETMRGEGQDFLSRSLGKVEPLTASRYPISHGNQGVLSLQEFVFGQRMHLIKWVAFLSIKRVGIAYLRDTFLVTLHPHWFPK